MVRVIQPAGFTKAPLLRAGLIDGVDEVVLLCTSEVISDEEIQRFNSVAIELGSSAKFRRVEIPAVGISASECMCLLRDFKNELDEDKETWVSVRGSTNLLSNCMMIVFEDFPLLSINPREEKYSLSPHGYGMVPMVPTDEQWRLYGLRYSDSEKGPMLFTLDGTLLAEPDHVELKPNGKVKIDWSIEQVENYAVERKNIASAVGALLSLNSINNYEINIPFNTEYKTGLTRLPPEINLFRGSSAGIKPRPNYRYENFQMPEFPIGKSVKNDLILHVCLNPQDITSTVLPIIFHRPDHVVFWVLPEYQKTEISAKQQGQLRVITEFVKGRLYSLMDDYLDGVTNWIEKGVAADFDFDCQMHLAFLPSLESVDQLNLQFPICSEVRFDILPGFSELHSVICSWLKSSSPEVSLWYSQQLEYRVDRLDYVSERVLVQEIPNHHLFPLRLLLVSGETRIDSVDSAHFDVLERSYENVSRVIPKSGVYTKDSIEVEISFDNYFGQYKSKIPSIESELIFGDKTRSRNTAGRWLEVLSAHLIKTYWPESSVYEGVKCNIVHGEGRLGQGHIDFDILAQTKFGIIVGECKIVGFQTSNTDPKKRKFSFSKLNEIIGQLMGHVGYIGHRKSIIPLIITSVMPPPEFYEFAHARGAVLCDWSELRSPELIIDRWKNGTPPSESRFLEYESQIEENKSGTNKGSKECSVCKKNKPLNGWTEETFSDANSTICKKCSELKEPKEPQQSGTNKGTKKCTVCEKDKQINGWTEETFSDDNSTICKKCSKLKEPKEPRQSIQINIVELLESTKVEPMEWVDFLNQREDSVKQSYFNWKEKKKQEDPHAKTKFYQWLETEYGRKLGFKIDPGAVRRGELKWIIWNDEEK